MEDKNVSHSSTGKRQQKLYVEQPVYVKSYTLPIKKARQHKACTPDQQQFELNLEEELVGLANDLYNRSYKLSPGICFIIRDPKQREVFAANFRDRVVHHLYYHYTHKLFERTFIADCYSCIEGRETHYGISKTCTSY